MVFLNHTSLYEPLFTTALPFSFLWRMAASMNIPGANITLDRPLVGRFWKLMVPNITSITRKRDESWDNFLVQILPTDIVMIAPEGRMKRPNGLDKDGKPMTIRGGIVDILEKMDEGDMLLCLSGGLHHVQAPGEHYPTPFKKISMNFSLLNIAEYKKQFSDDPKQRRIEIVKDLQSRLERDCPKDETYN